MPHCLTVQQEVVVLNYAAGTELSFEESQRYRTLDNARAWWGESKFVHKDAVLKMLRNADGRWRGLWNQERKQWGTTDPECAINLMKSQKWTPFGVSEMLLWPIIDKMQEAVAERNASKRKREEAAERKRVKEEEREVEKRRKQAVRNHDQRKQKREAEEPPDAPAAHNEPPAAAKGQVSVDPKELERAKELGLTEEIFVDCATWPFLGPTCSTQIARVERWFNFRHNKERGRETVARQDFVQYYEKILKERREFEESERLAAAAAARTDGAGRPTEEEARALSRDRERNRRENWQALKRERERGPHALALQAILERAKKTPRAPEIVRRQCNYCEALVIEQFLECGCNDKDGAQKQWFVCDVCHTVKHADVARGPCRCDGDE